VKPRALIFGVNGQDGHYLSALLVSAGLDVAGISRSAGSIRGDIGDAAFVESTIRELAPDFIFHFAANSSTRHETLFDNHRAIATGSLNVLEAARVHAPRARIFLSGSAMQFRNEGRPIDERTEFEGSSPYSIARIHSVYAARYFRATFGMRVYVGYLFNHDSPLRSERHVNQKIVATLQRIVAGSRERLALGNIEVRKEFNFAGDVVGAVWTLVNQDLVSEAVIGCGVAHGIVEWLECCFGRAGLVWQEHVDLNSDFVPEYQILVSNPATIQGLGWRPTLDLRGLADLMMAHQ
jgi:GDPmannose 4,6-dehydratase